MHLLSEKIEDPIVERPRAIREVVGYVVEWNTTSGDFLNEEGTIDINPFGQDIPYLSNPAHRGREGGDIRIPIKYIRNIESAAKKDTPKIMRE